jgi:hypothetical protein
MCNSASIASSSEPRHPHMHMYDRGILQLALSDHDTVRITIDLTDSNIKVLILQALFQLLADNASLKLLFPHALPLLRNGLLELSLQHTVQEATLSVAVEQADNALALLNSRKSFVVTQLARKVEVDVLAVFLHLAERAATAASADAHAADLHVTRLLALWDCDREALWIAETEADAVDDGCQRNRFVEADDAAHASARVTVDFGGGDGVALVGTTAQGECSIVES